MLKETRIRTRPNRHLYHDRRGKRTGQAYFGLGRLPFCRRYGGTDQRTGRSERQRRRTVTGGTIMGESDTSGEEQLLTRDNASDKKGGAYGDEPYAPPWRN